MSFSSCLTQLQDRLGYHFKDQSLLRMATTHRSTGTGISNERLEFLGDAVIGLIVGTMLFNEFPEDAEGVLSQKRSQLVRTGSLAQMAHELRLGECLALGGGEENTGGRKKEHILEDAMEAVIGAIFVDSNFGEAKRVVEGLFEPLIGAVDVDKSMLQDYKSALQESIQARNSGARILYRTVNVEGPPHLPVFTVQLQINDTVISSGTGASKKRAEQNAARVAVSEFESLVGPALERTAN